MGRDNWDDGINYEATEQDTWPGEPDPDKAYDEHRQRCADDGVCHICDGTGTIWKLGPGYDGEEDVIPEDCPRCGGGDHDAGT